MHRLLPTMLIAAIVFAAGCAGQQEFARGKRLYELQQYEEAMKSLEAAVAANPSNDEYSNLLSRVRETAARTEYNRGLLFYGKNQLSLALDAFEAASSYDPSLKEARQAYDSVKARKDVIEKILTEIPSLLSDGKPDEALDKIDEVQNYTGEFPQIRDYTVRALQESTVLHAKRGTLALHAGEFARAQSEFQIALNRTPGYSPATNGLSAANTQVKAASLVDEGRGLLTRGFYAQAYDKLRQALSIVPGHAEATSLLGEVRQLWSSSLVEEAERLGGLGGFDNQAEALRRYERAGALSKLLPGDAKAVEDLKRALAGEFLARGKQYEELGEDYHGLALINYQMSLYCDGAQVELSRRVVSLKEGFDERRAFYLDIRGEESSIGTSFSKQLTQTLKRAVIESGIKELYVVAPYETFGGGESAAAERGLAGRRLTIFASLLSEPVVVRGEDKPEVVRSSYKVGTRYVPNPDYDNARKELVEARAVETEERQDYDELLDDYRAATTDEERESIQDEIEYQRTVVEDAEDKTIEKERALARTAEQVEEEVFQPYDYLVYTVTMEAKVEVSLEVADPYRGATQTIEVISGSATAEDTYNEDVKPTDVRGVVYDPKELPTQSELLADARRDAAVKAVEWLKGALAKLSMQYYDRARELDEIGNLEGAAEYYYAFYLSAPDKTTHQAREAIDYVRKQSHLITPDERRRPE